MTLTALNTMLAVADLAALELCRRGRVGVAATIWASFSLFAFASYSGGHVFAATMALAWILFLHLPLTALLGAIWLRGRDRILVVIAALGLAGVGLWATFVEPYRLEISTVELEIAGLEVPISIVVLADIQTDRVGDWEARVLAEAARLEPDLVLLPGDYVQASSQQSYERETARLRELFRSSGLRPSLGGWAIQGNVEALGGWIGIFRGTGIEALEESTRIDLGPVVLTGLTLWDSFDTRIRLPQEEKPHIVFGHGPDFALGDVPADLLIAGHTHGGQVRLPWIGPLLTFSQVPRSWASGVTPLDEARTLVVSRGIGMERGPAARLRFLCRPEVLLLRLSPARS